MILKIWQSWWYVVSSEYETRSYSSRVIGQPLDMREEWVFPKRLWVVVGGWWQSVGKLFLKPQTHKPTNQPASHWKPPVPRERCVFPICWQKPPNDHFGCYHIAVVLVWMKVTDLFANTTSHFTQKTQTTNADLRQNLHHLHDYVILG